MEAGGDFALEEDPFEGLDEFRDDLDDDLLAIANDHLNDADICELAGEGRIEDVRTLSLVVDTTGDNSILSDLGVRLPQLTSLKLSGSSIASIRDLGSSWARLDVLWLSRCGLSDLDGLHGITQVRELYLAFNDISDLSALVALEQLSVLDLEANKVADLAQVEFLSGCAELSDLSLQHNPVSQLAGYRATVSQRLPQLHTLDELKVAPADRAALPAETAPAARPAPAGGHGGGGDPTAVAAGGGADAGAAGGAEEGAPAQMMRELQLVVDGVKYAQVHHVPVMASPAGGAVRPGTALSGSRPTTSAGSYAGRPPSAGSAHSGGAGGQVRRPRTSWRSAPPLPLTRGSSDPARMRGLRGAAGSELRAQTPPGTPTRRPGTSGGRPGSTRPPTGGRCARGGEAARRARVRGRPAHLPRPPCAARARGRPGTAQRIVAAGGGNGRPPAHAAAGLNGKRADEQDNASQLTMGTQNIFCGTGIRALRAHKLRPADDGQDAAAALQEAPRATGSGIRALRARRAGSDSGADGDRGSEGSGERSRASTSDAAGVTAGESHAWSAGVQAEGEQWEQELLLQLKAVKIEEAWEGRDSFAAMEMGLDLTDAEAGAGAEAEAEAEARPGVRVRVGRAEHAHGAYSPLAPSVPNAFGAATMPPMRPGALADKPRARPGPSRPGVRPGSMSTVNGGSINVLTLDDSSAAPPAARMVTTS